MRDYRCDRCKFSLRGIFIETDISPRFLGVADDATLLGYAETQHLMQTGCMGSLVVDTALEDAQRDWYAGALGLPRSMLSR